MQAVILAGGAGTRLQGLFPGKMKALVPIHGKAFIEWQINWLRMSGITRVHIAGGLYSDQLIEWQDSTEMGAQTTISIEPEPLGTGGAMAYAFQHIEPGPVFCVNGDTLLPRLSLDHMVALLNSGTPLKAIIATTTVEDAARFGTIHCSDHRVTGFEEKKRPGPGLINGGVYLMTTDVFTKADQHRTFSIEQEIFPAWSAERLIACVEAEPPLMDMGTPEGLEQMSRWISNEGWGVAED